MSPTSSTFLLVGFLLASEGAFAQFSYVPLVVPAGFAVDTLADGLTEPVGLAFLPDGRVLVVERGTADVRVWTGGTEAFLVGTVPNVSSSQYETGLLAIAVDPAWPARPYVYVWFDASDAPFMRLAMFTIVGDLSDPTSPNLALGAEYDILTDVPDASSHHNGGSIRFGPDGTLYLSTGDDTDACAAQDIDSSLGCVLRMNVSGLPCATPGPPSKSSMVPAGNPFQGPTDNARLVWCYGLRNPFRFHIDPVTGHLLIADVGAALVDEIDESTVGGENFGWPWLEASVAALSCARSATASVAPIAEVSHHGAFTAVMSLGVYRNVPNGACDFGAGYEGDYFLGEYYSGTIRRLSFDGAAWVPAAPVVGQPTPDAWATGFQTVVDTAIGPDGALYFVRQYGPGSGGGSLGRIRHVPDAQVLTLVSGDGQPGNAGLPLQNPLVVRLTTVSGAPIAGVLVAFTAAAGGGYVDPAEALTDALGIASSVYTLSRGFSQPPLVLAAAAGTSYVAFHPIWRGISVDYEPAPVDTITVEVFHSQTSSPFTLVWEPPQAGAGPYLVTPWGDVWTSVLSPAASLPGFLDGLGFFGAPDPQVCTGASSPSWTMSVSGLAPLGTVTLLFQAYAIDTSRNPASESIMISNAQVVTIN